MLLPVLPLVVVGLAVCLRRIRSAPHRALMLAMLAAPLEGALAQTLVPRDLVLVVPASLLAGLGLAALAQPAARVLCYAVVAVGVFAALAAVEIGMLAASLSNGPTWYHDYGLYGLRYGARQVTAAVRQVPRQSPATRVHLSPTWANGTDVIVRFFLPEESRVDLLNVDAFRNSPRRLDSADLLVMTPDEYRRTVRDRRFADVRVVRLVRYPDGAPGF